MLLFQISYRAPKAKLRRNGHTWIAKSAAEWCEETALTPQQYKDAIARLPKLDLRGHGAVAVQGSPDHVPTSHRAAQIHVMEFPRPQAPRVWGRRAPRV
jgi:hypothetical protein